jgi:glutamate-1-semialdehyde aminotransferase
VYFAPSAYEVGFLNLAMTETDLDQAAEAVEYALGAAYSL